MNARARHSPETREPDTESRRISGGSTVAMGACLCGRVHYAVDRPLETLSHYSDPASGEQRGAPGLALVGAPLAVFRWLSGEERLTNYDQGEGARRSFCRGCGSSMPVGTPDKAGMLLPLASLNMPEAASRQAEAMPA